MSGECFAHRLSVLSRIQPWINLDIAHTYRTKERISDRDWVKSARVWCKLSLVVLLNAIIRVEESLNAALLTYDNQIPALTR